MARYKVCSEWSEERASSVSGRRFSLQSADITDTKNGTVYRQGAYRVCEGLRPAKVGKGGTVPFYGELAWAAGERLFGDLVSAVRYA
jgi:hypothetical protein